MDQTAADYVVGLGSNLGSRVGHLQAAVECLERGADLRVIARSSIYETEPLGPPQPRYLNAAVALQSALPPRALLARLLEIERLLGRERAERWGPRTIDLDILWGTQPLVEPDLCVPHAALTERAFALLPLLEVAPSLRPRYAAALHALGSSPAARGVFSLEPDARVRREGALLHVEAHGESDDDATSAVLTVLGRALGPALAERASESDLAPVLLHARSWPELVEQALELARGGRAWRRALVAVADGSGYSARLLGMAPAVASARAHGAEHAPHTHRARIAVALDP